MRRMLVFAALLFAGCGEGLTPEEQALQDERDIAKVEQANDSAPPLKQVSPEPILYPDIERHDLFGAACNYAPGTSLGTRVIAREADAFMKINGEIVRFAADPGAREFPLRTRSLYTGREYSLRLVLEGEGAQSGIETVDFEGQITLYDAYGRTVYEGEGLAQCGS
jgi:hypothetical protein